MAAIVAVCSGLGRKKLTHLVMAAVSLTHPRTHVVGCSQYKQISTNEDLPIPMENSYKELLSRFIFPFIGCIRGRHKTGLCGKKQKEITKAIKRPQGFMPVTYKDAAYLKDPTVCNIRYQE
uniref:Mitochondrial ribosomal protein S18C n=1 Tax=Colobus angolensis palliatus TaxID=336983 RepID=A0A2K5K1I0_COLAP